MIELTEHLLLGLLDGISKAVDESGKKVFIKPTKLMLGEAWLSQFDTPQEAYDAAVRIMKESGI